METDEVMDAAREAAFRDVTGPVQTHRVRIGIHGKSWDVLILSVNQFVGWIRVHDGKAVWRSGSLVTGMPDTERLMAGSTLTGFFLLSEIVRDWYERVAPLNGAVQFPSTDMVGEFVARIENQAAPAPAPQNDGPTLPEALAGAQGQSAATAVDFNPYSHTAERHPPASGFSEADLNGVPLVTTHPAAIPAAVAGFLLFVAILGAPYAFYEVVRWGVTAMAVWSAIVAGNQKRTGWAVAFYATAVLFNPLIPVYLSREAWVPLDFAALVLFISAGVKLRASQPATSKDGPTPITG